jgi:hypothetical protein
MIFPQYNYSELNNSDKSIWIISDWCKMVRESKEYCKNIKNIFEFEGKCRVSDLPSWHPYWKYAVKKQDDFIGIRRKFAFYTEKGMVAISLFRRIFMVNTLDFKAINENQFNTIRYRKRKEFSVYGFVFSFYASDKSISGGNAIKRLYGYLRYKYLNYYYLRGSPLFTMGRDADGKIGMIKHKNYEKWQKKLTTN